MALVLADTNLCLRLVDEISPVHEVAGNAVKSLLDAGHIICVASQVLAEFWVVATRPLEPNGMAWTSGRANAEITGLLRRFRLLRDTPKAFPLWRLLVTRHDIKGKRAHDARLAAVMEAQGVSYILTFNGADFATFPNVTVLDPVKVAAGEVMPSD